MSFPTSSVTSVIVSATENSVTMGDGQTYSLETVNRFLINAQEQVENLKRIENLCKQTMGLYTQRKEAKKYTVTEEIVICNLAQKSLEISKEFADLSNIIQVWEKARNRMISLKSQSIDNKSIDLHRD